MTSYFFDTNFLFKTFFNRSGLDECSLKNYLINDSEKFISKNVEYEFSNIFLEFENRFNHLLIGSYYNMDELDQNINLTDFQRLTKNAEILKFSNDAVTTMIWKTICGDESEISKDKFRMGLQEFILDFNCYFHLKYNRLINQMSVHQRLSRYEELENILKPHIHAADIRICLDAHDVAVTRGIDDLALVSADSVFMKNYDLIVENTKISEIIRI